jgi:hypothetical protein
MSDRAPPNTGDPSAATALLTSSARPARSVHTLVGFPSYGASLQLGPTAETRKISLAGMWLRNGSPWSALHARSFSADGSVRPSHVKETSHALQLPILSRLWDITVGGAAVAENHHILDDVTPRSSSCGSPSPPPFPCAPAIHSVLLANAVMG